MLSTILYIDIALFIIIAAWVFIINTTGNTDQKGGVGFVAFFLTVAILIINVLIGAISLIVSSIRG